MSFEFYLQEIYVHTSQSHLKPKTCWVTILVTLLSPLVTQTQVSWNFGSMLLAPLLKKFAPYDTYSVWKQGLSLRVDGTLVGLRCETSLKTLECGRC